MHFRKIEFPCDASTHCGRFLRWYDGYAEFTRRYILNVLFGRDSVFREITFWYNNMPGDISDREDVIDRILFFVTRLFRDG